MPQPGSTVQLASNDKMIGKLKFPLSRIVRSKGAKQGGVRRERKRREEGRIPSEESIIKKVSAGRLIKGE